MSGKFTPRYELFETSRGGVEPYLINGPDRLRRKNPALIVANGPKKKGKKMPTITLRRNRKGQFVKGSGGHKRKKKRQSNFMSAGSVVNSPHKKRRKSHGARQHNKRRRHNPPSFMLGGSLLPPVSTIVGVGAGLVGPPIVSGLFAQYSPSTVASNPTLVKIGSNLAVLGGAYFIFGRKAARDVALGEIGAFLAQQAVPILQSIFPSLAPAAGVSGYTRTVQRGGSTGLGRGGARRGGMNSYTAPVNRQNLAAFPARASRFASRFRR